MQKLVQVKTFLSPTELEDYLNQLAHDPSNRYNLELLTDNLGFLTGVFYLQPEPEPTYNRYTATSLLPSRFM